MQDKILEVIYDLNLKRLEAEEGGREEYAEELSTASKILNKVYL